MRNRSTFDRKLDDLVSQLRDLPSGTQVVDLAKAFNADLQASIVDGRIHPKSYLGMMTDTEYAKLRKYVERLSTAIWKGRERISTEELLSCALSHDKSLGSISPCNPSKSYVIMLAACDGLLVSSVNDVPDMALEASLTEQGKRVCELFDLAFAYIHKVHNPLATLANVDKARSGAIAVEGDQRREMIRDLEGLSTRLWQMQTVLNVRTLRSRLLQQDDCGEADLSLLFKHSRLIGIGFAVDAGRGSHANQGKQRQNRASNDWNRASNSSNHLK